MFEFGKLCAVVVLAGVVASCGAPVQRQAAALTPAQSEKLGKQLTGKTAGEPQSCISLVMAKDTIRISDDILLYRVSRNLVYRNDLRSSCPGLARDSDIIVTKTTGTMLCSGEILRLVDRQSGFDRGACSLGEFTPYRTTKKN